MIAGHYIIVSSPQKFHGFGTIGLVVEVDNMFRQLVRILRETQLDKSMKYRFFLIISLLTNVVFRLFVIIRLFCFMLTQWGNTSIFQFSVGTFGAICTFHISITMFCNTWKKLTTARESGCHNDADGYEAFTGKEQ